MSPEQPENIHTLYTRQRAEYSAFAPHSFTWKYMERPFLDTLLTRFTPTARILDAGCGVGRTLNYLLEKGYHPQSLTGTDLNPDMLETTKQQSTLLRHLVQSDIEHPPFTTDSFDLAIASHVLHYCDNSKYFSTLKSFYRILKPGGTLYLVTTHPIRTVRDNLKQYLYRRWINDHTPWGTTSPLYYRPITDVVNLAIRANFRLESLDELEILPEAKDLDPQGYANYSVCPPRLALTLTK